MAEKDDGDTGSKANNDLETEHFSNDENPAKASGELETGSSSSNAQKKLKSENVENSTFDDQTTEQVDAEISSKLQPGTNAVAEFDNSFNCWPIWSDDYQGKGYVNVTKRSNFAGIESPAINATTCSSYTSLAEYKSPMVQSRAMKSQPQLSTTWKCCRETTMTRIYKREWRLVELNEDTMNLHKYFMTLAQYEYPNDVTFIDSHCHLDLLFDKDEHSGTYEAYRQKMAFTWPKCYEGCITNFCFPDTFMKEDRWKDILSEGSVYGSFGCHPHKANLYNDEVENFILNRMEHDKVIAFGEIGLDYSQNNQQDHNLQKRVFGKQLELAVRLNKPIVLHCRDATEDCFEILKTYVPHDYPIHRHCFLDSYAIAETWTGYFTKMKIGLTPFYAYRANDSGDVGRILRHLPLDKILVETDAPYFLPEFYKRPDCGALKWNHPGMAFLVAAKLATVRDLGMIEVLKVLRENTSQTYFI